MARIETAGADNPDRTIRQHFYLTTVCQVTDGVSKRIAGIRSCHIEYKIISLVTDTSFPNLSLSFSLSVTEHR